MHSRVAVLFFVGLISLELTACALMPGSDAAQAPASQASERLLLDRVLLSEKAERPRLWQEAQAQPQQHQLARVLLQSLPGHAGHAPGSARQTMLTMLDEPTLAAADQRLLQLRLLDLKHEMFLENALNERNQRLKNLIQIERDLQQVSQP